MAWRKCLVRSLVFTVAGGVVAAAFAYQHWTNPEVVRQQVIAQFGEHLPGAYVSLESARLRLFGGISFSELRLSRRDDPSRTDFLYVPSGTIYHDKEQLLNGKLAIRRIDWYQPTLRVIRGKDGCWNLARILAAQTPEVAIPILVLQQATIWVEDRQACPDLPPLEIRDVNLTVVNDPHRPPTVSVLAFTGTGRADLAGTIHVEGTWGRLSDEFTASVQLPSFPVDGRLVQHLSKFCPQAGVHARQLTGTGQLQADLSYHPQSARPWRHDVRWQLSRGQLSHAELPFPLDNLEAKVRCVDGQVTLEKLTAQSGSAQMQLTAKALALDAGTDILDGRLEATHVPVAKELFDADNLHDIQHDYAPQGTFSLSLDFCRRAGRWREHCTIHAEDMTGVCAKFPYRLDHITGTIDQESDRCDDSKPVDLLKVDLLGYTGSQPVYIQGEVEGKKPAAVRFRIWAKDLPIDDKLCAALQPEFQKVVRSFNPSGRVDIEAHLRRAPGSSQFNNQYIARFHDASVRYDVFPYPLEGVGGTLDIQPGHWEYRDFHGTHKGGEFRGHVRSVPTPQGNRVKIDITGTSVLLDAELKTALRRPALENTWQKLAPAGRMDFVAHVDLIPGQQEPDIDVTVTPRRCTIKPEFFPYALTDLCGTAHYRQREVELYNLSARHGPTVLSLEEGKVFLKPGGDFSVDLVNLLGNPIVPDPELFKALPPALAKACTSLGFKEPLSLLTNLTIDVPADRSAPPHVFWDGGMRLKDATLSAGVQLDHVHGVVYCRGQHRGNFGTVQGNLQLKEASIFRQSLRDIHCKIAVDAKQPDALELLDLKARLFGGDVGGALRVEFGPTLRYEANLTASQIQLAEFSRHNRLGPDAQQRGLVAARLDLQGQGTDLSGLEGWGSIDVPNGKMYNLPLLLDLLKFLSLRLPDRTFFEEAHARFTIRDKRVAISRLDLLGAAISLGGNGTVNLDGGDINMDLYAVWGRIVQLSPPVIKELWPTLSKQLLRIKMKGKIGETPRFKEEPVPPLKDLLERMAGKQNSEW